MTRATSAVYLYCLVRAARRPAMTRVPAGVPGGSHPETHAIAPGMWMVAAHVPLDVYGPTHLEPRLRDLDWVSQAAVAHESVVEHFARAQRATVLPMKLFTMFSSVEKAAAALAAGKTGIQRIMRRIAGAEEWGIRVFLQPSPVVTMVAARSGTDFLRGRKQARDAAATARADAADAAQRAYVALRRHARDARVRDARQAGTNPPVLDAAFLVPTAARVRFKAEARRQANALARAGAELVVTGPWPPYNFAGDGAIA
jgi:hypothetical protein